MFTSIQQTEDLRDKKILLRGDLDVALEDGEVREDFRLQRLAPTIKYLLDGGAKVILIGHLGRPDGKVNLEFSLAPVLKKLKSFFAPEIAEKFKLVNDIFGAEAKNAIEKMQAGELIMLENLRFYPGEEKNDKEFANELADLGDIFVNDCFSTSHRKHASIVGVAEFLPAYAGLNMEQEIEVLSKCLVNPEKPAIAIMGGAKLETKLPLIEKLSKNFDYVLVGGKLALEYEKMGTQLNKNIIMPADYNDNFDIGEKTTEKFSEMIKDSKTVIWNGPLGKFEDAKYLKGTEEVALAVINSGAYSIIGGGDTIAALNEAKLLEKFGFVSTGGGAMLEFLEKGTLVGIEALKH